MNHSSIYKGKIVAFTATGLAGVGILWLLFQLGNYGGIVTDRFRGKGFEVVNAYPLEKLLAVHADYPRLLIFRGSRYQRLEGSFPYIIEIPQLDSILFIQGGDRPSESVFVLLNLVSGQVIEIPFGDTIVGTYGFGRRRGSAVALESVNGPMVVLRDQGGIRYKINTKSKTLLKENRN